MAASSFVNVCRFSPTAGGTTDWTYSSASTGYQSPSAAGVVNGRQYSYRAESADLSQWEVGQGAYNTGTGVLARTAVLFNSSGTTSKISFSAAPQVAIVALAEDLMPRNSGATLAVSPSDPASTVSTTGVMMGLGATCALTPNLATRVKAEFIGLLNSLGGNTSRAKLYYGTGTAPTNGAAITGTQAGNSASIAGGGVTNLSSMFMVSSIITGLTPGTAYWFDIVLNTSNAASAASIANITSNAFEF